MVDTQDLKSCGVIRVGSSPTPGILIKYVNMKFKISNKIIGESNNKPPEKVDLSIENSPDNINIENTEFYSDSDQSIYQNSKSIGVISVGINLIHILGPLLFIIGILVNIEWLWIIGGIIMVFIDFMDLLSGILNPLAPVLFAILGIIFIHPWYLGVFVSIAIFQVINIPFGIINAIKSRNISES